MESALVMLVYRRVISISRTVKHETWGYIIVKWWFVNVGRWLLRVVTFLYWELSSSILNCEIVCYPTSIKGWQTDKMAPCDGTDGFQSPIGVGKLSGTTLGLTCRKMWKTHGFSRKLIDTLCLFHIIKSMLVCRMVYPIVIPLFTINNPLLNHSITIKWAEDLWIELQYAQNTSQPIVGNIPWMHSAWTTWVSSCVSVYIL